MDNSVLTRLVTPRPSAVAGRTVFTYSGPNANIPVGNAPSILDKDYTITAEITVPKGGAEGMIATMGGRFGGYGLYLLKGKPVFVYNLLDLERYRWEGGLRAARDLLGKPLAPGKHTLVFDFKYDGPGPGKGGTGVLTVDGKELAKKTIPHTIPMLMSIDESFDIGSDTRTGVDDSYTLPFRFTGTIDKLTYKLGPDQMTAEEKKALEERVAIFGQPHEVDYSQDGAQSVWTYYKIETSMNAWSYVPYLGLIAGGTNEEKTQVYFFFDSGGKLFRMQTGKASDSINNWVGIAKETSHRRQEARRAAVARVEQEMQRMGKPFDRKRAKQVATWAVD